MFHCRYMLSRLRSLPDYCKSFPPTDFLASQGNTTSTRPHLIQISTTTSLGIPPPHREDMATNNGVHLNGAVHRDDARENGAHENGAHENGVHHQYDIIEERRQYDIDEGRALLRRVFQLIMDEVIQPNKVERSKVINFKYPKILEKELDLELQENSTSEEGLMELCKATVNNSVHTNHPFFNNQLFQGGDPIGVAGIFLSSALNTSIYTYEMAPVFSLMENTLLRKIGDLCGYEEIDGTMCPGGSLCNMYAMNLARYTITPEVKREGVRGFQQNVVFASDVSHYSMTKGAAFMGIGSDNVYKVKSDETGKMIPEKLEEAIISTKEKGNIPLIVVATAGTTVSGAFDPIDQLADICEKYGIWLHVDAAWGGSVLLSRKHKHKMAGVHRSDSLAWCLHKMMGAPLQCSAFVLNKKGNLLSECHSAAARYLFQADKFYGAEYDTGDKSIQCSRLPDAFKAWFMWKAKGDILLEQEIDHKFDIAETCAEIVRNREGFRLIWEPECTNVCFWYVPTSLRHLGDGPELWEKLDKFAPLLKKKMMTSGVMMVTYMPLKEKINFWRMVFSNTQLTHEHLVKMLDEFERLAEEVEI